VPDPEYFDRFYDDVGNASAFEMVLRGHLWVEGELLRSLDAALPFPDRVDLSRVPFGSKVGLVAAHGLMHDDEQAGYRRLNALRNRMAHTLGEAVTEQDESDLINALGQRHRQQVDAVCEQGLTRVFPHRLHYSLIALCVSLQVDRQRMEDANERLRQSARRLVDVADGRRVTDA
jgi:hypothetical protein